MTLKNNEIGEYEDVNAMTDGAACGLHVAAELADLSSDLMSGFGV